MARSGDVFLYLLTFLSMKIDRGNIDWGVLKWGTSDVHSRKENRRWKYKEIGARIKACTLHTSGGKLMGSHCSIVTMWLESKYSTSTVSVFPTPHKTFLSCVSPRKEVGRVANNVLETSHTTREKIHNWHFCLMMPHLIQISNLSYHCSQAGVLWHLKLHTWNWP